MSGDWRRGLLTGLHWIGYVTTLIVVVELIALGYLLTHEQKLADPHRGTLFTDTRTRNGPLLIQGGIIDENSRIDLDAVRLAERLPALDTLDGDGIRFVAMPSFGRHWYAVALWRHGPGDVRGMVFDHARWAPKGKPRKHYLYRFKLDDDDFADLTARFDRLAQGHPGDRGTCFDGTPIAFERIKGKRIISGTGSASCSEHYRELSALILNAVDDVFAGEEVPGRSDWTRSPWDKLLSGDTSKG